MTFYRIALLGHPVFSEGDPVWDCFEQLSVEGHAVEIIDLERFPGVFDSDGNPDERALEAFRRRFKPDYIAASGESAEEILSRLERSSCEGSAVPFRRFVVFGYVGKDNFGDELIFSTICDEIARRYPDSFVTLIGHDPEATLRRHGVVSVTMDMKLEADIILDGASALVFMAGIIFDDPFVDWTAGPIDLFLNPRSEIAGQTAFVLMAAMHGTPSVFLGIGAGPLSNPDAKRLVALSARNGAFFVPRDVKTEELLLAAGVPETSISTKCDLAFLAKSDNAFAPADYAQPYCVVSLRDHRTKDEGFEGRVADVLDRVWEGNGIRPLFIDLAPEDGAVHRRVASLMAHGEEARFFGTALDTDAAIDTIAHAEFSMAMRLHCSIVSNAHGVPSLGFDYNEKVHAFYEQMGQLAFLSSMDESAAETLQRIELLIEQRDHLSEELSVIVEDRKRRAVEAFDILGGLANRNPKRQEKRHLYTRSTSIEEVELVEARACANRRAQELQELRAKLDGIEKSTSWKVGCAVTVIPRIIKDRLS